KEAFLDSELKKHRNLTSANSINIARLIPQSFYYFHAMAQMPKTVKPVVFSVPSGNYGNLSAGLMAKQMGLKFDKMLACSNVNKIVPDYLSKGVFDPQPSQMTISNAMDVGNPSNFARMSNWYEGSVDHMREEIAGYWFDDDVTRASLKEVYEQKNYLMDPHGTIGYLGLKEYQQHNDVDGIFLETAHPAKFIDVVEETISESIEIPARLKACLDQQKSAIELKADFEELKQFLLS
ncbi:MAG: threonine synthase, partial [Bacteroidota bacterium]